MTWEFLKDEDDTRSVCPHGVRGDDRCTLCGHRPMPVHHTAATEKQPEKRCTKCRGSLRGERGFVNDEAHCPNCGIDSGTTDHGASARSMRPDVVVPAKDQARPPGPYTRKRTRSYACPQCDRAPGIIGPEKRGMLIFCEVHGAQLVALIK